MLFHSRVPFAALLGALTISSVVFGQDIVFPEGTSAESAVPSTTPPAVRTTPIPAEVSTVADNSTDTDSHVNAVQSLLSESAPAPEDDDKIDLSPSAIGGRSVLPRQYSAGCRAPTRETGTCGPVRDCPGIYRIRDSSYLRTFLCGYQGQTPLVCCPTRWTANYYYGYQAVTTRAPQYGTTSRPAYVPTSAPITARPPAATSRPSTGSLKETRPRKPSFLPGKCGVGLGIPRIVGGIEATPGHFPWMAAIYIQSGSSWLQACGGALVSNKHVVTAAHCVISGSRAQNLQTHLFHVRLGDHNLVTTDDVPQGVTHEAKVAKISRHSGFDSKTYKNDIAIMELDEPVTFNDYIKPICLPYDAVYRNLDEEIATVTGWGYTKYDGQGSDVLRQANIRIWPQEECKNAFRREVPITDEYLCAGDGSGKKDSCQGDSGGPLIYNEGPRYYLIGVVSFGKKCATPGYPGAYTRITKYLDWLNDHF